MFEPINHRVFGLFLKCSDMFPSKFEQIYIQLFWKGTELEEPDKRIIKSFDEMESKKIQILFEYNRGNQKGSGLA